MSLLAGFEADAGISTSGISNGGISTLGGPNNGAILQSGKGTAPALGATGNGLGSTQGTSAQASSTASFRSSWTAQLAALNSTLAADPNGPSNGDVVTTRLDTPSLAGLSSGTQTAASSLNSLTTSTAAALLGRLVAASSRDSKSPVATASSTAATAASSQLSSPSQNLLATLGGLPSQAPSETAIQNSTAAVAKTAYTVPDHADAAPRRHASKQTTASDTASSTDSSTTTLPASLFAAPAPVSVPQPAEARIDASPVVTVASASSPLPLSQSTATTAAVDLASSSATPLAASPSAVAPSAVDHAVVGASVVGSSVLDSAQSAAPSLVTSGQSAPVSSAASAPERSSATTPSIPAHEAPQEVTAPLKSSSLPVDPAPVSIQPGNGTLVPSASSATSTGTSFHAQSAPSSSSSGTLLPEGNIALPVAVSVPQTSAPGAAVAGLAQPTVLSGTAPLHSGADSAGLKPQQASAPQSTIRTTAPAIKSSSPVQRHATGASSNLQTPVAVAPADSNESGTDSGSVDIKTATQATVQPPVQPIAPQHSAPNQDDAAALPASSAQVPAAASSSSAELDPSATAGLASAELASAGLASVAAPAASVAAKPSASVSPASRFTHKAEAADQILQTGHLQQTGDLLPVRDVSTLTRSADAIASGSSNVINSASDATGNPAASSQQSSTFTALDSAPDSIHWTHAGAQHAEAGYQDPTLGWVGVRAEGSRGQLHATVLPGSSDAAQILGGHMAGLHDYLAAAHSPVQSVTLSDSREAASGSTPDQGSSFSGGTHQGANQGSNQGSDQGTNSGAQSGAFQNPTPAVTTPSADGRAARSGHLAASAVSAQQNSTAGLTGAHISVVA